MTTSNHNHLTKKWTDFYATKFGPIQREMTLVRLKGMDVDYMTPYEREQHEIKIEVLKGIENEEKAGV